MRMVVRVRLRIRSRATGFAVATSALVNSGYEVEEPEILLPRRLTEHIGIPLTPPHAKALTYETPFGFFRLILVYKGADVHLVDACSTAEGVNVAVSDHEREVLISDKLASVLGIQLIDIGRGLWRHINDPHGIVRESAPAEYW